MAVVSTYLLCLRVKAKNQLTQAPSVLGIFVGVGFFFPFYNLGTVITETNEITPVCLKKDLFCSLLTALLPQDLQFMESAFPEETLVSVSEHFQNQN